MGEIRHIPQDALKSYHAKAARLTEGPQVRKAHTAWDTQPNSNADTLSPADQAELLKATASRLAKLGDKDKTYDQQKALRKQAENLTKNPIADTKVPSTPFEDDMDFAERADPTKEVTKVSPSNDSDKNELSTNIEALQIQERQQKISEQKEIAAIRASIGIGDDTLEPTPDSPFTTAVPPSSTNYETSYPHWANEVAKSQLGETESDTATDIDTPNSPELPDNAPSPWDTGGERTGGSVN